MTKDYEPSLQADFTSLEGYLGDLAERVDIIGGHRKFINAESKLHNSSFKKPHKQKLDLSDINHGNYRYTATDLGQTYKRKQQAKKREKLFRKHLK